MMFTWTTSKLAFGVQGLSALIALLLGCGGLAVAVNPASASGGISAESRVVSTTTSAAAPSSTTVKTASTGPTTGPAPLPREKRVLENVHTDAVSVYLDNGVLNLQTKADIDADGDGAIELGHRLVTEETLFHLDSAAKTAVPNMPAYSFLGSPGAALWLAPQTQDYNLIWPGFSTEDPNLRGRVKDNRVTVRMLNAQGPGNVELFLQSGTQPTRIFSSRESLPDWTLDVPQHVHMNWAFSAAGTYRLTFEVEAVVDGKTQHARNDYVFVVGDLAKHQQSTTSSVVLVPGTDAPSLRASVTPAEARGAVQFVDRSTGAILGHVPVDGQIADFPLDQLPPGTYSLAAQFVPKWITDYKGSTSSPVEVTIAGEPDEKPGHDDVTAPTSSQLSGRVQGDGVKVVVERSPALPLDPISVSLSNADHFGKWVSVWLLGKNSAWQGWHRADLSGRFALTLAEDVPAGDYQFVVRSPDGTVLGWDSLKVGTGSSTQPTPTPTPQPTPKPTPKPTPDSGSTSKPKDKSQQKSKKTAKKKTSGKTEDTCTPAVTLDHGHIDAFYVSEAGGEAVMQLMEDVTGYHVLRAPETVLMKVKESANQAVASGMPGAPRGYVLPLTQDPALVWPGWDTNNTKSGGYTNVGIHVTKVAGPGTVHIHSQGSFGEVLSVLDGGRTSLPGVIRQAVPAHTHAQWVFSKKGVYELTAHAVLTNPDTGANVRTASHTYVFQVGDVPLGDVFCGAKPVDRDTARKVNAKVAERAKTALAADQAEEGLDQALDAVAADQADAVSALGAQTASLGGSDVRGDGNPQEVAGALGPESLEQSLAVLPLRAWIVIGLGLVVVMVATTYTAFRLGKNQRLSLGAVAA